MNNFLAGFGVPVASQSLCRLRKPLACHLHRVPRRSWLEGSPQTKIGSFSADDSRLITIAKHDAYNTINMNKPTSVFAVQKWCQNKFPWVTSGCHWVRHSAVGVTPILQFQGLAEVLQGFLGSHKKIPEIFSWEKIGGCGVPSGKHTEN